MVNMKNNILSIFLVAAMLFLFAPTDSNAGRRGCKGSQNCTACTSCSGCKHCAKQGGSCGVCYTPPKKVKKKKVEKDTVISDSVKVKNK